MWPVAHQGFASPGYAPLDPPPSTTAWYLVAHSNFKRGSKKIHAFVFPPYRKGITFGACSLCTPWLTAFSSSLSDLMGRSEKSGRRVQFFTGFSANSDSIRAVTRGKMNRLPAFCSRLGQVRQAARLKTTSSVCEIYPVLRQFSSVEAR